MLISTKIRERKDHLVITIYKEEREKYGFSIEDIIVIKYKENEIIRPIRKDFHISLPKKIFKKYKKGDQIKLEIIQKIRRKSGLKRPKINLNKKFIDLRAFVPLSTIHGKPIYIISKNSDFSYIWYPVGGGAKQITLKNKVNKIKIAELLGFFFGDGTTCDSIRSFRLTNCESSTLIYCLSILDKINIKQEDFKVQIIYSTNKELNEKTKKKCINFWSKELAIELNKFISVSKAHAKKESSHFGSARIILNRAILIEILKWGLLDIIVEKIKSREIVDNGVLIGFLRGSLAAEGCVYQNKNTTTDRISISFNSEKGEGKVYKKLLDKLQIEYNHMHKGELAVSKYHNLKKLYNLDIFKFHDQRKKKFCKGLEKHRDFKI